MKKVLPVIVVSQFFCTSLWFAGNAVTPEIIKSLHLDASFLAHVTSAVQLGFIAGTLLFALSGLADRFSPAGIFLVSSLVAAFCNLAININGIGSDTLLLFRFLTGFCLAGVYPVGMKIASDHYTHGLGRSLGFLVGALVLGTALPHLLKSLAAAFPWQYVIVTTSVLSALGGLAMYFLAGDGPERKKGVPSKFSGFIQAFRNPGFRSAAFGYFGHMWELYTFWAFVPVMLTAYAHRFPGSGWQVSLAAFFIIASGSVSCVAGGVLSKKYSAKKIAGLSLLLSGACCVLSPVFLFSGSYIFLFIFLLIWGMTVVADSPLFSTLVAQNAPPESKGTAITFVTSVGFAITIVSIQLLNILSQHINRQYLYMVLAIGPMMGLRALWRDK